MKRVEPEDALSPGGGFPSEPGSGLREAFPGGVPERDPAAAVADHVSRGLEQPTGAFHRVFAGIGEMLLVSVEIVVAVGILRIKHFNLIAVALVFGWAAFRAAGFWRRFQASRRARVMLERGVAALRERDYRSAGTSFGEAFRLSQMEEAGFGYAYAAGKEGNMLELLRAARLLFRVNLHRLSPDEIMGMEGYRAFLADPDFRAVRPRLRAILLGDTDELAHVAPGILRRRLVQVFVGLLTFTMLAFILTAIMTFL